MTDEVYPDDNVTKVTYAPRSPSGCRVTVIFRAHCPTCPGLPFPLRTDMQEAHADALEHDLVAHSLAAPFRTRVEPGASGA